MDSFETIYMHIEFDDMVIILGAVGNKEPELSV